MWHLSKAHVFILDTENTAKGIEGCIYRMQIDNIFPLKRAFQDPIPYYITLKPEGKKPVGHI